jgi:hypothetical protein
MHNKLLKRAVTAAVILVIVLLASVAVGAWRAQKAKQKPDIGLITTLPMRWGEGDAPNAIDAMANPAPAYVAIQDEYDIRLIDSVDNKALKKTKLLMLAQPRAFTPQELVDIDSWVRGGGRMLILADPALSWESAYPLGDKRRPLFTSLLSPLFTHWGIELVLPMDDGNEKAGYYQVAGERIKTITPGAWQPIRGRKTGNCSISDKGLIAQCTVGKGQAILIADADLMNAGFWQGTGLRTVSQSDDFANMSIILKYLHDLDGQNPR